MSIFHHKDKSTVQPKQINTLSKTIKQASRPIEVYLIYENLSDDIAFYASPDVPRPLYVALTHEEAIAACIRLLYIKHINHYFSWCKIHSQKPGVHEESWLNYMDSLYEDINIAIEEDFKILGASYTVGDLLSVLRTSLEVGTILGLPSETPGEVFSFVKRGAEMDRIKEEVRGTKSPYEAINCEDTGEVLGKIALFDPEEYVGQPTEGEEKSLREIFDDIAEGRGDGSMPAYARRVYGRAIEVADQVGE